MFNLIISEALPITMVILMFIIINSYKKGASLKELPKVGGVLNNNTRKNIKIYNKVNLVAYKFGLGIFSTQCIVLIIELVLQFITKIDKNKITTYTINYILITYIIILLFNAIYSKKVSSDFYNKSK